MPDVSIAIDGRTFSGSFAVLGQTIMVSSVSLGTKTAVLGNVPAAVQAKIMLRELMADRTADGSL
jgi:hypothetical protein